VDDEHRAVGVFCDGLADRSQPVPGEAAVATVADDQQLRALAGLDELARGVALALAGYLAHRHGRRAAEDLGDGLVQRRGGLLVVAGVALVVAIPFVITVGGYLHPSLGWWEGRYTLPLAVGVPLLAVARGRPGRPERRVVILLAWVILAAVLVGQVAVYWHAYANWLARPIAHPPRLDIALGTGLLVLGAAGILASIAWSEYRARATRISTHG
jgi:hypothetical protein